MATSDYANWDEWNQASLLDKIFGRGTKENITNVGPPKLERQEPVAQEGYDTYGPFGPTGRRTSPVVPDQNAPKYLQSSGVPSSVMPLDNIRGLIRAISGGNNTGVPAQPVNQTVPQNVVNHNTVVPNNKAFDPTTNFMSSYAQQHDKENKLGLFMQNPNYQREFSRLHGDSINKAGGDISKLGPAVNTLNQMLYGARYNQGEQSPTTQVLPRGGTPRPVATGVPQVFPTPGTVPIQSSSASGEWTPPTNKYGIPEQGWSQGSNGWTYKTPDPVKDAYWGARSAGYNHGSKELLLAMSKILGESGLNERTDTAGQYHMEQGKQTGEFGIKHANITAGTAANQLAAMLPIHQANQRLAEKRFEWEKEEKPKDAESLREMAQIQAYITKLAEGNPEAATKFMLPTLKKHGYVAETPVMPSEQFVSRARTQKSKLTDDQLGAAYKEYVAGREKK